MNRLRSSVDFDLFGRGFSAIDDKWDGLAPYRYSIVVENFCNPYYWTEKLADCFLSWTFPIYYGCTGLHNFFPKDSFLTIDIHDPDAVQKIRYLIHSDLWLKNIDTIHTARQLVLNKYQLFPFISNEIWAYESAHPQQNIEYKRVTFHNQEKWLMTRSQLKGILKTILPHQIVKVIKSLLKRCGYDIVYEDN